MEVFRQMTNHCIRTGLVNNVSSLGKLSSLCYNQEVAVEVRPFPGHNQGTRASR
jgi:hypothetical protein